MGRNWDGRKINKDRKNFESYFNYQTETKIHRKLCINIKVMWFNIKVFLFSNHLNYYWVLWGKIVDLSWQARRHQEVRCDMFPNSFSFNQSRFSIVFFLLLHWYPCVCSADRLRNGYMCQVLKSFDSPSVHMIVNCYCSNQFSDPSVSDQVTACFLQLFNNI